MKENRVEKFRTETWTRNLPSTGTALHQPPSTTNEKSKFRKSNIENFANCDTFLLIA